MPEKNAPKAIIDEAARKQIIAGSELLSTLFSPAQDPLVISADSSRGRGHVDAKLETAWNFLASLYGTNSFTAREWLQEEINISFSYMVFIPEVALDEAQKTLIAIGFELGSAENANLFKIEISKFCRRRGWIDQENKEKWQYVQQWYEALSELVRLGIALRVRYDNYREKDDAKVNKTFGAFVETLNI